MGARRANSIGHQGIKPQFFRLLNVAAEQVAEKVNSKPLLVAQVLLPVLVLLHLLSMHSQEWLCYSTFSATCEAATHKTLRGAALKARAPGQSTVPAPRKFPQSSRRP